MFTKEEFKEVISFVAPLIVWIDSIERNPNDTQGRHIRTDKIELYVRNMARGIVTKKPVMCIASVEIAPELRGRGVFTAIIDLIKSYPGSFKELEIENILEPRLLQGMYKQGFVIPEHALNIPVEFPVTLIYHLGDNNES